MFTVSRRFLTASLASACVLSVPCLHAQLNTGQPQILSTNQIITPLAPAGSSFQPLNPGLADDPEYTVGQAVSTTISPDGKTLLILTSGYNSQAFPTGAKAGSTNPTDSTEWIFVFDISRPKALQKQAIPVPNTYSGIVWSPNGSEFFVSGGNNDNVHMYSMVNGSYAEEKNSPVALGHVPNPKAIGSAGGLGLATQPEAAGLAVSKSGNTIVVANYENDSISTLTKTDGVWKKTGELDLRPGKENPSQAGVAGGEFPFWVAIKGENDVYVSSVRDREVVVIKNNAIYSRIHTDGQPNKMVQNKAQNRLYVAQDNRNTVVVIDTDHEHILERIPAIPGAYTGHNATGLLGANPNSVALSPDEKTLYITDAGLNAVAVVGLSENGQYDFEGYIPTGFYPNSVSVSPNGKMLYIVNGKSATGPNPQYCTTAPSNASATACNASNQYIWQLTKAGFQQVPTPSKSELQGLTKQVVANDHLSNELSPSERETMTFLSQKIKHVIYIIKENRTYDQVLGDLEVGNGDPTLTQFPQANTPNFHKIARNFVDFDNFYDVSDVSGDGWPWSTSARTTDVIEKEIPVNYAGRGLDNDSEGTNRNLNVGIPTIPGRLAANPLTGADPDLLPGNADVAAPDDEQGEHGQGYLWNSALKAGRSVRDYGMFLDIVRYNLTAAPALSIKEDINAFADKYQVAYSTNTVLSGHTDPYFRGFDNTFPDYYRFTEWQREFKGFQAHGNLPNLSLVRLMHDHFGNFGIALNGVNTPELQIADNDYAVGSVIDAVAHSQYKDNTLIFVIEDDAQDGGDHVDAHRSTAFVVGPYVRHRFVDSTRYNTVNMLSTIEHVLNIKPLNMNDNVAAPMADAFDIGQKDWTFNATPSAYLANTTLPIPKSAFSTKEAALRPLHDGAWWAEQTKGMDFSVEDHLDSAKFNQIVWRGVMGETPYPTNRSGKDLRTNRADFLAQFRASQQQSKPTTAGEPTGSSLNPNGTN